jgi:hypothetical protein
MQILLTFRSLLGPEWAKYKFVNQEYFPVYCIESALIGVSLLALMAWVEAYKCSFHGDRSLNRPSSRSAFSLPVNYSIERLPCNAANMGTGQKTHLSTAA